MRPPFADCAELCTVFGAGGSGTGARRIGSQDSGAAKGLGMRSKIESGSGSGWGAMAMARMDWAAFKRTMAGVEASIMRADGVDGRGGEPFGLFPPEEGLGLAQPAENKA